jgi:hypothetical protein
MTTAAEPAKIAPAKNALNRLDITTPIRYASTRRRTSWLIDLVPQLALAATQVDRDWRSGS